MSDFTLEAFKRQDLGKGASRRLRRNENKVPAIIYGSDETPETISLLANKFAKLLEDEEVFSHVLSLNIDGKSIQVLIKDLQRHPAKNYVMHADFIRVKADQKLTAHVPIHFVNEDICIGVKQQGGSISHLLNEVEVICLPKDLPAHIELDLANIEVGKVIHLSDIKLPSGVEFVALNHNNDLSLVSVNASKKD